MVAFGEAVHQAIKTGGEGPSIELRVLPIAHNPAVQAAPWFASYSRRKQKLRRALTAFYTKHNVCKLEPAEFDPVLNYFVGRCELLNAELRKAYGADLTSVGVGVDADAEAANSYA